MKNEIERWWDAASEYYQEETRIPTDEAHYGPFAPSEKILKLLGGVKNKSILELGCGGGQCSIAFAKKGAKATGIDISSKQLAFAKRLTSENGARVNFVKGDAECLDMLKDSSFDIVFSAFALMYIKNLRMNLSLRQTSCFSACRIYSMNLCRLARTIQRMLR